MARTRISKIAKDLNIAVSTAVEFLRKKNIEIDDNPNTRIEEDIVDLLLDEFDTDGAQKAKKTAFLSNNKEDKEKESAPEKQQPQRTETVVSGPKVIGRVEIDAHGNVVKKAPQPAKEEKPAPAPAPKPAPAVPEPAPAPVAVEQPKPAPARPEPVKEPVKPAAPVAQPAPAPKPAAPAPEVKKAEPKPAPAKVEPQPKKRMRPHVP